MERFVRHENIKRYRKLLLETTDNAERRLIQKLLTAEEQKEPPDSSLPMLPANAMREHPRAGTFYCAPKICSLVASTRAPKRVVVKTLTITAF
jgi:hypothetical protein